jgi:ATP-dependent Clp protease ATP-binding subunit ClpX
MDTVSEVVVNEEAVGPDASPLIIHDDKKKKKAKETASA